MFNFLPRPSFEVGAYSFSHKIWGERKRQFKRYTLLQLLFLFRSPLTQTLMLFPSSAFKKDVSLNTVFFSEILQYSNKYPPKEIYIANNIAIVLSKKVVSP